MSEPKLPQAGEYVPGLGRVVTVEDVQPPPPPPVREWVVEEVTAEVELRLNGKPIRDASLGSYCDANYGRESCIGAATRVAADYCERERIAASSQLEVVVVRCIDYVRMVADPALDYDHYGYRRLTYARQSRRDVPEARREVVWSSRGEVAAGAAEVRP